MARLLGPYAGFPGDSTRRTTTQELPLGTEAVAANGAVYVYVKAGEAIAAKKAVTYALTATPFSGVLATSAVDQAILGCADAAFASGEYGWVLHKGVASCLVTDAVTAGTFVYSSATSGLLAVVAAGTAGGDAVLNRTAPYTRCVVLVADANSDTNGATVLFR